MIDKSMMLHPQFPLHDERHRPLRERPLRQHARRRAYVKNGCAASSNVTSFAALHRPVELTTV